MSVFHLCAFKVDIKYHMYSWKGGWHLRETTCKIILRRWRKVNQVKKFLELSIKFRSVIPWLVVCILMQKRMIQWRMTSKKHGKMRIRSIYSHFPPIVFAIGSQKAGRRMKTTNWKVRLSRWKKKLAQKILRLQTKCDILKEK